MQNIHTKFLVFWPLPAFACCAVVSVFTAELAVLAVFRHVSVLFNIAAARKLQLFYCSQAGAE